MFRNSDILFDNLFITWYIIFRGVNNIFRKEVVLCQKKLINTEYIQIKSRKNLFIKLLDVQDLYTIIILISEKKYMRMIKLHSHIICVLKI